MLPIAEAEPVGNVEGNIGGPLCEAPSLCRGRRPHHAGKERVGTWETSCRSQSQGPGPSWEARMSVAGQEGRRSRTGHSTVEGLEQGREERRRRAWRERDPAGRNGRCRSTPRTRRVIGGTDRRIETEWAAQAPNIDRARLPARARCGKAARRDLWGRCRVTGASTRPSTLGVLT
jgi:hypothetical protein